jgi:tRNA(Ser,Leu) C12 N-acetylase TAN1
MPIVIRQKDSDPLKSAITELNSALEEMNAAYDRVKEAQANLDKIKNTIGQNAETPIASGSENPPNNVAADESIDRLVDLARIR